LNVYTGSGEEVRLVQELARLTVREVPPKVLLTHLGDGLEDPMRHVFPDDRGRLKEPLLLRWQSIDPRGQHGLDRRRNLDDGRGPGQPVGSSPADERSGLDQGADALLQKERIPFGALDEESSQRREARIAAEQGLEELPGTLGRQGVQAHLCVVGLAAPAVFVLRAVVHEEHQPRGREALDQAVEERLCLTVDPVEIFDDGEDRPILGLPQEEALECVQGALPTLSGVEHPPGGYFDRHIQKREESRQCRLQRAVQRQDLSGHLLLHCPRLVSILDLK
jgi:hypothetical protein